MRQTFFPLNTIRLKLQVDETLKGKSIAEAYLKIISGADGFAQLYQGLQAQIICLAASNFIYFYSYQSLKVRIPHRTCGVRWMVGGVGEARVRKKSFNLSPAFRNPRRNYCKVFDRWLCSDLRGRGLLSVPLRRWQRRRRAGEESRPVWGWGRC